MAITQQHLKSINVQKLKQLENVSCFFEPSAVSAILGVNGCGKSTILHALACCFQPQNSGQNHRFCDFFLPNNYNEWNGSSFSIDYSFRDADVVKNTSKNFKKLSDRWTRYVNRPIRDVFYIGIDSCVPDIEKERSKSKINIQQGMENQTLQAIINKVSFILGGNYQNCFDGSRNNKKYRIIKRNNIEYPSIAMGAGEQRLLTILDIVFSATPYSLILIDELDLTLHTQALNRLLDVLIEQADRKHLQIIFTTHREIITRRTDINIRHIHQTGNKTFCFEGVNNACMDIITGSSDKIIKVFVEDQMSKSIIEEVSTDLKIARYCDVQTFGEICNGFAVAAVKAMENNDLDNTIIVLDGDKLVEQNEKEEQLNNRFSGNTDYEIEIRHRALSLIKEYNSPDRKSPERFIVDLIQNKQSGGEVFDIINNLGVMDAHNYVKDIADRLGVEKIKVYPKLIQEIKDMPEWIEYINPIKEWFEERKQELNLNLPN